MNLYLIANTSGVFSLLAAAIAISPALISLLRLPTNQNSILHARIGLMFAVCLGLLHGLLMTQQENINFYDINTYWIYAVGLFTFNLLAFIALMYGELKLDRQKLNYFSYGVLLLLACHVGQQLVF